MVEVFRRQVNMTDNEKENSKKKLRRRAFFLVCLVIVLYVGFIGLMSVVGPGFGPSDPASFD